VARSPNHPFINAPVYPDFLKDQEKNPLEECISICIFHCYRLLLSVVKGYSDHYLSLESHKFIFFKAFISLIEIHCILASA